VYLLDRLTVQKIANCVWHILNLNLFNISLIYLYFPGTFNINFAYNVAATPPDKAWIVLNYGDGSPDTAPVPWALTYSSQAYSYAAPGHYFTTITVYNLASSVTRKLLVCKKRHTSIQPTPTLVQMCLSENKDTKHSFYTEYSDILNVQQ